MIASADFNEPLGKLVDDARGCDAANNDEERSEKKNGVIIHFLKYKLQCVSALVFNNVDNDTGNKQRYTDDTVSKLIKRMKSTVSRRLGNEGCEYQKQNYTAHKE